MCNGGEECSVEKNVQSEHSAGGIITCDEKIARLVYDDIQIDQETGNLTLGAFPMDDLVKPERRGWSLTRLKYVDAQFINEKGAKFVARKEGRTFHGLSFVSVKCVREVRILDQFRDLCVIDAGDTDDPAHSLVVRSSILDDTETSERALKVKLKPVREKMIQICSPVFPVDDIFKYQM